MLLDIVSVQIQVIFPTQVIDLEEGAERKKSESVIGGGEDTVIYFWAKRELQFFFVALLKNLVFNSKFGCF